MKTLRECGATRCGWEQTPRPSSAAATIRAGPERRSSRTDALSGDDGLPSRCRPAARRRARSPATPPRPRPVMDQLLAAGTPVDAEVDDHPAIHWAREQGPHAGRRASHGEGFDRRVTTAARGHAPSNPLRPRLSRRDEDGCCRQPLASRRACARRCEERGPKPSASRRSGRDRESGVHPPLAVGPSRRWAGHVADRSSPPRPGAPLGAGAATLPSRSDTVASASSKASAFTAVRRAALDARVRDRSEATCAAPRRRWSRMYFFRARRPACAGR